MDGGVDAADVPQAHHGGDEGEDGTKELEKVRKVLGKRNRYIKNVTSERNVLRERNRSLENRIPIAACNTYGTFYKRKFLGNSKIISFIKGNITPSKLKLTEGPLASSGSILDDIDLDFPRKLREIRLNEKIDETNIKIKKIERNNKIQYA